MAVEQISNAAASEAVMNGSPKRNAVRDASVTDRGNAGQSQHCGWGERLVQAGAHRNPKHEIRNPKQITNPKLKTTASRGTGSLSLAHWARLQPMSRHRTACAVLLVLVLGHRIPRLGGTGGLSASVCSTSLERVS